MDFQLTEKFNYWWPVKVSIPNPDPDHAGKVMKQTFKMQFEAIGRDTQIANQEKLDALTDAKQIVAHEHDFLRLVCKNWVGVVDDKKSPVAFNDEAFRAALQKGWFREAVYAAYNESLSGKDARLGN
jgi:hypothetical protein